jgi:integrase
MKARKLVWGGSVTWEAGGESFKMRRDAAKAHPGARITKRVDGEQKSAWVISYKVNGKRRQETFQTKKAADLRAASVTTEKERGTFTVPDRKITVRTAGEKWVKYCEGEGLERSTITTYRAYLRDHILPKIGDVKLGALTRDMVEDFRDSLVGPDSQISRNTAQKIMVALYGVLKRARLPVNPAAGVTVKIAGRNETDLEIPTPEDVSRLIAAAEGRARPYLMMAAFCGLRASEIRGLRWSDVDLAKCLLTVAQRADRFNAIGVPKSKRSKRTLPFGPMVQNALKEWRLACPKSDLDLVFPNRLGHVQSHGNDFLRMLRPTQEAAGLSTKFGLHSLRHFYASWCASRGISLLVTSRRLGHSSIAITADRYSHLFKDADDSAEIAAAERALVAVVK